MILLPTQVTTDKPASQDQIALGCETWNNLYIKFFHTVIETSHSAITSKAAAPRHSLIPSTETKKKAKTCFLGIDYRPDTWPGSPWYTCTLQSQGSGSSNQDRFHHKSYTILAIHLSGAFPNESGLSSPFHNTGGNQLFHSPHIPHNADPASSSFSSEHSTLFSQPNMALWVIDEAAAWTTEMGANHWNSWPQIGQP